MHLILRRHANRGAKVENSLAPLNEIYDFTLDKVDEFLAAH